MSTLVLVYMQDNFCYFAGFCSPLQGNPAWQRLVLSQIAKTQILQQFHCSCHLLTHSSGNGPETSHPQELILSHSDLLILIQSLVLSLVLLQTCT